MTIQLLVAIAVAGAAGDDSLKSGFGLSAEGINESDVVSMLPGIVEPAQQAVLSAPINGVLMEVSVHVGDRVDRGQVLAVVDNRIAAVEVRLAEAATKRTATAILAEQELRQSEALLARLLSVDRAAVSELEVDQATANRDRARASKQELSEQAAAARLNLQLARTRYELHNLRSPLAGEVLRVESQVGESVTNTSELILVANLRTLRVELRVPVEYFQTLSRGDVYQLAASRPISSILEAKLTSFEPVIDAATQTFRCIFEIDNRDERLPSGFAVRLMRPGSKSTGAQAE